MAPPWGRDRDLRPDSAAPAWSPAHVWSTHQTATTRATHHSVSSAQDLSAQRLPCTHSVLPRHRREALSLSHTHTHTHTLPPACLFCLCASHRWRTSTALVRQGTWVRYHVSPCPVCGMYYTARQGSPHYTDKGMHAKGHASHLRSARNPAGNDGAPSKSTGCHATLSCLPVDECPRTCTAAARFYPHHGFVRWRCEQAMQ